MKVRIYKRNGFWYCRDGSGLTFGFVTWSSAMRRALIITQQDFNL